MLTPNEIEKNKDDAFLLLEKLYRSGPEPNHGAFILAAAQFHIMFPKDLEYYLNGISTVSEELYGLKEK